MIRHLLISTLVFWLILSLTGCPTNRPVKPTLVAKPKAVGQFLTSGQFPEAAVIYRQLAENESGNQNHFQLLTIEALMLAGNENQAQVLMDSLNKQQLTLAQLSVLELLKGQHYLKAGNIEQALEQFQFIIPEQLQHRHQIIFYQSLAFVYALKGWLTRSVNARISLSELLTDAAQKKNNYKAILTTLNKLPHSNLIQLATSTTGKLSGWASLAKLLKISGIHINRFNTAFSEWQQRFPEHPGNSLILETFQRKSREPFRLPNSIAILLPETGSFARAAYAIKEGFMAAFDHQDAPFGRPELKFYNSSDTDIQGLYREAIANGAELVIGPLQKNNIERLAQELQLNIPVLALNQVPDLAKENLYQLALNPEHEARQMVIQALKDGHRKALLLVPDTAFGERIANAISQYWQQADGIILETQTYNPKVSDYSYPIKQLLNLDESRNRALSIKRILPALKFIARRRHDVDAIFMIGRPQAARLINPQLQFYRALRVPVYASAKIYGGLANPAQDIDLDNITFCDAPWLFNTVYQGPLSLDSLQENWQQFSAVYLRLFALGIDAYSLLPHLDTLADQPYAGATGNLLLADDNHINRELVCAKFVQGIAKPFSFNADASIDTDEATTQPNNAFSTDTTHIE